MKTLKIALFVVTVSCLAFAAPHVDKPAVVVDVPATATPVRPALEVVPPAVVKKPSVFEQVQTCLLNQGISAKDSMEQLLNSATGK